MSIFKIFSVVSVLVGFSVPYVSAELTLWHAPIQLAFYAIAVWHWVQE